MKIKTLDDFSDKKNHKLNKTSSSGFFPKMKYIKIIIIVFKIIILKNILKEIEINLLKTKKNYQKKILLQIVHFI